ncbi:MAG: ATP-dependent Clp protease adaptor ClpS [Prevotella sp.]|uniref:ATP-dependent Clp protease adaptor ClpS n=1 Tax=Prevotella sp. AGR2160 TaxID=1280674 RepID=UPI00048BD25F|nr:ATP-dependent Clp protease adaptor ClpS [Prevotella sp. AGR2160]MDD5860981.1 ATP-dependent Clp protease adaptor ClpS [Prevotella sp.]
MAQEQCWYSAKERTRFREPRKYKVTIYNDDFTTMDFVVHILVTVFHKTEEEAQTLMLTVHKSGSSIVGVYSYDIARTKVEAATKEARNEGFPLRITYTPE